MEKTGKVYIVGAGPGDIGLLTIKGLKCLKSSDAVIYDFHLNAQILNYISSDAEFIYAGKRGGHHTMTQDEINSIIVRKAKEGKIVCRLKGGDPFVFGRGGEEAEALANEGIEFEIVPGISSSVAAPAYAGIPLTHRKYSSTFSVIPGYEDITKENSSIDWAKLSTGAGTLVFLMAVKNISELTKKLIENGRPQDTPVAVIRWGTRADQRTLVSTLGNIAGDVNENDIRPPAVMVVGEVVRLRETLNWYERKPLFGMRVLQTREGTAGFEPLEELGAEVISMPTVKVVPPESYDELDYAINAIPTDIKPDWIVFTSANGVKFFFKRYFQLGKDIRELSGIKICSVGQKTADSISAYGIRVDMVPDEFRAEGLIESFKEIYGNDMSGVRILLPRAKEAREKFPDAVRQMGGIVTTPTTYQSFKPMKQPRRLKGFLKEGRITVAVFASGAAFRNFMEIMGNDAGDLLNGVAIASIGPVTSKTIEKYGHTTSIMPKRATIQDLVSEIITWASHNQDKIRRGSGA